TMILEIPAFAGMTLVTYYRDSCFRRNDKKERNDRKEGGKDKKTQKKEKSGNEKRALFKTISLNYYTTFNIINNINQIPLDKF
ncbi:MAG: hypothetical protein ACPL1D_02905, partial [Microgenomates group bacterium]